MCPAPTTAERTTSEADLPNEAPWAGGYLAWARAQLEKQTGAPVGRLVACSAPPADFPLWLAEVYDAKPDVIATGFLPDEVDWHPAQLDVDWDWFIERWVFLPFRFGAAAEAKGRGDTVVYVSDMASPEDAFPRVVAEAVANAAGLRMESIRVELESSETVARRLAGAKVAVGNTSSWGFGFALDELMARLGRPSLCYRETRYSPLRFVLCGRQARPAPVIGRLKPAFAEVVHYLAGECLDGSCCLEVFGRPELWRRWMKVAQPSRLSAPEIIERANCSDPISWLERPASWRLIESLETDATFPREALGRLRRLVAEWALHEEASVLAKRNAARWLCRRSEWIGQFAAGGTEARSAAERWVRSVLELVRDDLPRLQLAKQALWAFGTGNPEHKLVRKIVVSAEGGAALAEALRGGAVQAPHWRVLGVEACRDALEAPASGCWADMPAVRWSERFGAAGPALYLSAMISCGRLGAALSAGRLLLRTCRVVTRGGVARLCRAALADRETERRFLCELARRNCTETGMVVLLLADYWTRVRRWEIWSVRPPLPVLGELRVLRSLLAEAVRSGGNRSAAQSWLARFAALDGDAECAMTIVGRLPRTSGTEELAWQVALALWLRGHADAARALLESWPLSETDRVHMLFIHAVAAQFVGMTERAENALDRLAAMAPWYFAELEPEDGRWSWTAAVFRYSGRVDESAQILAHVLRRHPGCRAQSQDIPLGGIPLAPGWERFWVALQKGAKS